MWHRFYHRSAQHIRAHQLKINGSFSSSFLRMFAFLYYTVYLSSVRSICSNGNMSNLYAVCANFVPLGMSIPQCVLLLYGRMSPKISTFLKCIFSRISFRCSSFRQMAILLKVPQSIALLMARMLRFQVILATFDKISVSYTLTIKTLPAS